MYKKIKQNLKTFTSVTAVITIVIGIILMNGEYNAANIAFIVWATSPYLFLFFLINLAANKITTLATAVITIATCISGLLPFTFSLISHLDSKTDLIFFDSPLWQWAGLIIVSLPLVLLNKVQE